MVGGSGRFEVAIDENGEQQKKTKERKRERGRSGTLEKVRIVCEEDL